MKLIIALRGWLKQVFTQWKTSPSISKKLMTGNISPGGISVTLETQGGYVWVINKRRVCNTLPMTTYRVGTVYQSIFYNLYAISRPDVVTILADAFNIVDDIISMGEYLYWDVGTYHRTGHKNADLIFSSLGTKDKVFLCFKLFHIRKRARSRIWHYYRGK